MIAHLSGKIIAKRLNAVILDVNGVGYKVAVPSPVWNRLETHLPAELHIHTIVREDELSLYGFETESELNLFELLLSVNGVGPKMALDLFTWSTEKITQAILQKDVTAITQIKGIGKKTAERIILELRSKLGALDDSNLPNMEDDPEEALSEEVLHALLGLGYQRRDIKRVFEKNEAPHKDPETMIKYFLKHV